MQHEIILILDFGSQYTQLIARRLRELGVKTVVERGDLCGAEIREASPIAIVLSGGPASVFEERALGPGADHADSQLAKNLWMLGHRDIERGPFSDTIPQGAEDLSKIRRDCLSC